MASIALIFLIPSLLLLLLSPSASAVSPISDRHRSAALNTFPSIDRPFASVEDMYEAVRTFQILGIHSGDDAVLLACGAAARWIGADSTEPRDLFYSLKVASALGCEVDSQGLQGVASKLQAVVKEAGSLTDLYHVIGGLALIKERGVNVTLSNADDVFHSIKSLVQSDGKWRHSSDSVESSAHASGVALETLAGVVTLASDGIDQSTVGVVKNEILKLFDSIKSYDDGSLYFDDEQVDASKYQGPLSTTSSVVRGLTKFASVFSGKINVAGDTILGLANFFLNVGIPSSTSDFFNQIESLYFLDNNRVSVPLILSLPSSVLSSSLKESLKVKVTTVFGSFSPALSVKLEHVFASNSKGKSLIKSQELQYDAGSSMHILDIISRDVDVGKYSLSFKILLHDPEHGNVYATGNQIKSSIFVTGHVKIDNAEISILDADVGSVDSRERLDFFGGKTVSLNANHLQKLRLSLQLTTPFGHAFRPHQVFLKMIHETKVEHIFELENSGKEFSTILNFLSLVERLYYLSGRYDLQLSVGDAVMENSFSYVLGHVDLDLPDAPEKAPQAPLQAVDPYLRFGPKSEISHIFRAPENRPPKELSLTFLAITLIPLLGFVTGLIRLGVNVNNFPSTTFPAVFSFLFHAGIAAVLLLYALFWLKLDLFTTLKYLGFLGAFLISVGHRALSHLAAASTKLKSS